METLLRFINVCLILTLWGGPSVSDIKPRCVPSSFICFVTSFFIRYYYVYFILCKDSLFLWKRNNSFRKNGKSLPFTDLYRMFAMYFT